MNVWTRRFLGMAKQVGLWSKDTTKVGAIAVGDKRRILETGYNGIPRGVEDTPERMVRPAKYLWTAHAEENLVAHAARDRLSGSTVFVTHLCCSRCARMLINAGVSTVVCGSGSTSMAQEEFDAAIIMFNEAGVQLLREEG
jgi:dCMP deaminase